jgi:hypothetical protein
MREQIDTHMEFICPSVSSVFEKMDKLEPLNSTLVVCSHSVCCCVFLNLRSVNRKLPRRRAFRGMVNSRGKIQIKFYKDIMRIWIKAQNRS